MDNNFIGDFTLLIAGYPVGNGRGVTGTKTKRVELSQVTFQYARGTAKRIMRMVGFPGTWTRILNNHIAIVDISVRNGEWYHEYFIEMES
jgi:hypothetical protein